MEHKIKIEHNKQYNFTIVSCTEGCFITSWKEGEDILNYEAFSKAYLPLNSDTSMYRCITDEDNEKYKALKQETLIKKEEEIEIILKEKGAE